MKKLWLYECALIFTNRCVTVPFLSVNVLIFNQALDSSKEMNGDKHPKENEIVIIKGTKQDDNTVFANLYAIQSNNVYTKLSDLKN